MERVMGIEPTWPAWKAGALPLSYTRFRGTKEIVSEIGVLSIPQMEFCFISLFFTKRRCFESWIEDLFLRVKSQSII